MTLACVSGRSLGPFEVRARKAIDSLDKREVVARDCAWTSTLSWHPPSVRRALGSNPPIVNGTRIPMTTSTAIRPSTDQDTKLRVGAAIMAVGVAVIGLAWFGVRRGQMWAWVTAVAAPVLALAVALPAHYPNHFDTLGHLGLIYADTLLFVVGAVVAFLGLRETSV